MPSVAEPLINYLHQLEDQGQTHVHIDEGARLILREFYIRAKTGGATNPAHAVASGSEPKGPPKSAVMTESKTTVTEQAVPVITVDSGPKAEQIAALKKQAEKCPRIKGLGTLRNTMVFSAGNPDADVMFVGEAPGHDEERLMEPFAGKAGQKFDGILTAMGMGRESVYISNIVKFRPSIPHQMTNNRKPSVEELEACLPFIHAEVKIVQPKVIIALGGTAAQTLLLRNEAVAKMRGEFHQFEGIPLRVTYHPSYILHNEATSEKRKLWEDMLSVMELLGLSISVQQRGYFSPKSI